MMIYYNWSKMIVLNTIARQTYIVCGGDFKIHGVKVHFENSE